MVTRECGAVKDARRFLAAIGRDFQKNGPTVTTHAARMRWPVVYEVNEKRVRAGMKIVECP